jgi:hypothetical protein
LNKFADEDQQRIEDLENEIKFLRKEENNENNENNEKNVKKK